MNTIRLFLAYAAKEKKRYVWGFVGSLFRFLIPLTVPLVVKFLLDDLLQNGALTAGEKTHQVLLLAAVSLSTFVLLRSPMEYVRQSCMQKANNNIIKHLRQDTFRKIHTLDAKYFSNHKSGEIGTRFFEDIEKTKGFMTAVFANVWIELIVLLFVIGTMFTLNTKLTLLSVLLVGLQFAIAHWLSRKYKVASKDLMQYRSTLSGFLYEKIQGTLLAKLFATEKRDREELERHLDRYERFTDRQARIHSISLASVNGLSDMTPLMVVFVGCLYVIDGSLTIGSLVAFFAYVDRMRSPVAALVQAMPAITEGNVALRRVFDFFGIPSDIREAERPVELDAFRTAIRFNRVSFAYDGQDDVIRELSFTIERGKTYAFVGASGGGKSTILHLLTRMYDATAGEVLIDEVNIRDYSLASLRKRMGIVTQDNFLYSSSVRDNIRLAKPEATEDEIVRAAKLAYAHEFILALPHGYDTEIGERGVKLSGGQKQRIALARVFLRRPAILLLDEATSALDNESERLVQASIQAHNRDQTVIMIAHRLSTVIHADRIFVLQHGRIVESGTHGELLQQGGCYRELYTQQQPVELGLAAVASSPAPQLAAAGSGRAN